MDAYWKRNDVGLKLLIAFFAWFSLFLFLHFREIRVETLELSSTADKYVIGSVDFEFPDDESTLIFKQDVVQNISTIYQMQASELRQVRYSFEKFLLQNPEKLGNHSYEEVYQMADGVMNSLFQARFTDAKTLQKIKELEIPVNQYFLFPFGSSKEAIYLPKDYWKKLKDNFILLSHIPNEKRPTVDFVFGYFSQRKWLLVSDEATEIMVKELLQKTVVQKYTPVKAGAMIIDKGEVVTPKHQAMIKAFKDAIDKTRNIWAFLPVLGDMVIAFILTLIIASYFYFDQKKIFASVQKLALIVCIMFLTLAFCKVVEFLIVKNSNMMINSIRYPLLMPFAAILFTVLLNSRIAFFMTFFITMLASVLLAMEHSCFLFVNFVATMVSIMAAKSIRKRKDVFIASSKCLVLVLPLILSFSFLANRAWGQDALLHIIASLVFVVIIAILVSGILPILESSFHVMTDITLMEYMDPTSELLRKLTLEMPGTYQHSLVLGNISEAVAQSIGANGLLCRVATLYHDIGKLNNIHYFTENQKNGVNIHGLLTPAESAQIIISHVTDGEVLAKKYHLPQPFIDIIREHHGTTLVYYFYCKELELKNGKVEDVDESLFRYPGPKPKSKESAIIMITDAVEAASRSLEDLSEDSFIELVEKIVSDKVGDKQFTECQLTFEELEIVKKTLVKTLMITRHVRIKYPEKKDSSSSK
jgi:putative nucleotidyltransferase with HDIG domain